MGPTGLTTADVHQGGSLHRTQAATGKHLQRRRTLVYMGASCPSSLSFTTLSITRAYSKDRDTSYTCEKSGLALKPAFMKEKASDPYWHVAKSNRTKEKASIPVARPEKCPPSQRTAHGGPMAPSAAGLRAPRGSVTVTGERSGLIRPTEPARAGRAQPQGGRACALRLSRGGPRGPWS